jgi:DNA-directed RNA polymerase specialized sigma24 family protein
VYGRAFEEMSSRNKGVGLAISLGLTETCNVLSARSAVASPCAETSHAAKRTAITFIAETAAESVGVRKEPTSGSLSLQFVVTRAVECDTKSYGEINVSRFRWFDKRENDRGRYAGKEEFASLFESERMALQGLALLLTADSGAARRCLIRAFRECIASSSVSKDWVLSWTRRMIIRNAISLVKGLGGQSFVDMNDDADNGLIAFSPDDSLGLSATSESILDLPEFDRFVFVICVLERYSTHDCALLLGKSPGEVNEVRYRVGNQVGQIDEGGKSSQRFGDELERPIRSGGAK